jgi:hypothetical protein
MFYRIGRRPGQFPSIATALAEWQKDDPQDAVIELTESGVYVEPINLTLKQDRTLQLRAANQARPVLRLIDWQTDTPDALVVTMEQGSRFTIDGLLVVGRPLRITAPYREEGAPIVPICGSSVVIRHCTFVPGWGIDSHCQPYRPAEPSLELYHIRATVRIEHSILGSIQVHENAVNIDPIPLYIADSIVDATQATKEAIRGTGCNHRARAVDASSLHFVRDRRRSRHRARGKLHLHGLPCTSLAGNSAASGFVTCNSTVAHRAGIGVSRILSRRR